MKAHVRRTAKTLLGAANDRGGACLLRCQVKTDAWTSGPKALFKCVNGWNLGNEKSTVVFNGEPREDLLAFVQGGKLAVDCNGAVTPRCPRSEGDDKADEHEIIA